MSRFLIFVATEVMLFPYSVYALDFSLVEMANQNRAREKAAEVRTESSQPSNPTVYHLVVPKTQAEYDYERKKQRADEVDRILQQADETLRTLDSSTARYAEQQDRDACARWRSTLDGISIGSDAVASVMDVLGYPDAISKYRGVRGEIENWRYSNSQCYVSVDVLQYRVVNVFISSH